MSSSLIGWKVIGIFIKQNTFRSSKEAWEQHPCHDTPKITHCREFINSRQPGLWGLINWISFNVSNWMINSYITDYLVGETMIRGTYKQLLEGLPDLSPCALIQPISDWQRRSCMGIKNLMRMTLDALSIPSVANMDNFTCTTAVWQYCWIHCLRGCNILALRLLLFPFKMSKQHKDCMFTIYHGIHQVSF